MVSANQAPVRQGDRSSSLPGNHLSSGSSPVVPVDMPVSKLDKLKKLWQRRSNFSALGGGEGTTPIKATQAPINLPSSLNVIAPWRRRSRRTTIGTDMIGFPRDFVHSKHVGIHDVKDVTYQPRHSVGPIERFDSGHLSQSLYRLTDSEAESQSDEEKTPASPVRRKSQIQPDTHGPSRAPYRRIQSVPSPPPSNKVKRKSVPFYTLQEFSPTTAQPIKSDHHCEDCHRPSS